MGTVHQADVERLSEARVLFERDDKENAAVPVAIAIDNRVQVGRQGTVLDNNDLVGHARLAEKTFNRSLQKIRSFIYIYGHQD